MIIFAPGEAAIQSNSHLVLWKGMFYNTLSISTWRIDFFCCTLVLAWQYQPLSHARSSLLRVFAEKYHYMYIFQLTSLTSKGAYNSYQPADKTCACEVYVCNFAISSDDKSLCPCVSMFQISFKILLTLQNILTRYQVPQKDLGREGRCF